MVDSSDLRSPSSVNVRNPIDSSSTPSTPNAADSVGVAIPKRIVPTTNRMTSIIGSTLKANARSFTASVTLGTS